MRKTLAVRVLVLVCLAAGAGCASRGGGANVAAANAGAGETGRVVADANALTDELFRKIETSSDPAAGVDEAQRLLDARGPELKTRIEAVRAAERSSESGAARAQLLECEITNGDRMGQLRKTYLDRWMRDAAFKAKLDKLLADYNALWRPVG